MGRTCCWQCPTVRPPSKLYDRCRCARRHAHHMKAQDSGNSSPDILSPPQEDFPQNFRGRHRMRSSNEHQFGHLPLGTEPTAQREICSIKCGVGFGSGLRTFPVTYKFTTAISS
eukprot:6713429-Prymnesium_polylepis.1